MKLYATTTSERASKGQGGEHLDIRIYNQERKEIGRLCCVSGEAFLWSFWNKNKKEREIIELSYVGNEPKGKKQKGEKPYKKCKYCDGDLRDAGSIQCAMYHEKYQNNK